VPLCPAICKSGGTCPRAVWSRRLSQWQNQGAEPASAPSFSQHDHWIASCGSCLYCCVINEWLTATINVKFFFISLIVCFSSQFSYQGFAPGPHCMGNFRPANAWLILWKSPRFAPAPSCRPKWLKVLKQSLNYKLTYCVNSLWLVVCLLTKMHSIYVSPKIEPTL